MARSQAPNETPPNDETQPPRSQMATHKPKMPQMKPRQAKRPQIKRRQTKPCQAKCTMTQRWLRAGRVAAQATRTTHPLRRPDPVVPGPPNNNPPAKRDLTNDETKRSYRLNHPKPATPPTEIIMHPPNESRERDLPKNICPDPREWKTVTLPRDPG
ncbi:hypothetical protein BS47DRAFT_1367991 [Hydnum rufescens UP504]|uniref:Uncharacterized protein n=1 Tax=Hydnum rufescens UP504 TaxID=1448309 RepID=A0A9P6AGP2_9AGAM|nr:hypothetical protein BS47DRAFT_1367991 [Hydnum rufescens UP504]